MNKSRRYQDIKEKRDILRGLYGGMMTLEDLMRELGYKDPKSARYAADEMGVPPTRIGHMKRYDTDLVARALVDGRGMA